MKISLNTEKEHVVTRHHVGENHTVVVTQLGVVVAKIKCETKREALAVAKELS